MDPGALARFFERVVKIEDNAKERGVDFPELLSTHPNSERRAARLRALARPGSPPSLSAADWTAVKAACPTTARPRTPSGD
jgi:predicted Zn-dependent protease